MKLVLIKAIIYKCMNIIASDQVRLKCPKASKFFFGATVHIGKSVSLPKMVFSVSWRFVHLTESNQKDVERHSQKTV